MDTTIISNWSEGIRRLYDGDITIESKLFFLPTRTINDKYAFTKCAEFVVILIDTKRSTIKLECKDSRIFTYRVPITLACNEACRALSIRLELELDPTFMTELLTNTFGSSPLELSPKTTTIIAGVDNEWITTNADDGITEISAFESPDKAYERMLNHQNTKFSDLHFAVLFMRPSLIGQSTNEWPVLVLADNIKFKLPNVVEVCPLPAQELLYLINGIRSLLIFLSQQGKPLPYKNFLVCAGSPLITTLKYSTELLDKAIKLVDSESQPNVTEKKP